MNERMFAIQLDGPVSLRRWSAALNAWQNALAEISKQVGQHHVLSLSVEGFNFSSVITEVSGEFDAEAAAVQFTQSYDSLGRGLREGNLIDVPVPLQEAGKILLNVARIDNGDGLILSSETGDFAISFERKRGEADGPRTIPDKVIAYGVLSGWLTALSNRGLLMAVIFAEFNDRAVRCFLSADQQERARKLWDQHVTVQGLINRDPVSGRPLSVKDIISIAPRATYEGEYDKFAWRKARGMLKHVHPELSSEELIRMARDA